MKDGTQSTEAPPQLNIAPVYANYGGTTRSRGWPHGAPIRTWLITLKTCATSGAGIFADGYDLQVINIVTAILNYLHPDIMTPQAMGWCTSMTLLGVVIGQLCFGFFADLVDRRTGSVATVSLTIIGAGLSACVTEQGGFLGLAGDLGICRFLLGLGMGGEYPISTALALENQGKSLLSRSEQLNANMICFGLGWLTMAALVIISLASGMALNNLWRFALAFGVIPSAVALVLRMMKHDQSLATFSPDHNVNRGVSGWRRFTWDLGDRFPVLIGVSICWCLFNFSAYGQTSFLHIICDKFFASPDDTPERLVFRNAQFAMAAAMCLVFANIMCFFVLKKNVPYRTVQCIGFAGMTISNWLCAAEQRDGSLPRQTLLLGLCMLWTLSSAWVGVTTYSVAGESFPMSVRGTASGIAAASGKTGAFIGTAFFASAEETYGLACVLALCGLVTAVGILFTVALTPDITAARESACSRSSL